MEIASVNANNVTAKTAGASSFSVIGEKSGIERGGNEAGNAPTVTSWVTAEP